jgi:ABC-type multidrug transport system fused ATPase/permease subunit
MLNTKLHVNKLHFDYNQKTKIFEGLSFELETKSDSDINNLYGVIGPSGTGKTTLISILGAQLKPDSGEIKLDDVDVYNITDKQRREIMAMQIQTASSLRGTLRYNLRFGLLEEIKTEDEFLIDVLKRVGLWNIFEGKDGLDTLIGEGGVNLSGGQRQRLNFAGLFLRSHFYKPKMILIDEPTASLDEISEKQITKMIIELSKTAIVIVIAHRLVTLKDSVAILDFSLIENNKKLEFLPHAELIKESEYYKELIEGKISLDDE